MFTAHRSHFLAHTKILCKMGIAYWTKTKATQFGKLRHLELFPPQKSKADFHQLCTRNFSLSATIHFCELHPDSEMSYSSRLFVIRSPFDRSSAAFTTSDLCFACVSVELIWVQFPFQWTSLHRLYFALEYLSCHSLATLCAFQWIWSRKYANNSNVGHFTVGFYFAKIWS